MKIVVYAIAKNEAKFVNRWVDSMDEADGIVVLDTGSTDNTVDLLKKRKVLVKTKRYKKWRFDKARNDSIKLIPKDTDICVCTDLDEVFESGWRKKLETIWQKNTTRCLYTYNWALDGDKPLVSFIAEKIHSLKDYQWIYPVHEVLKNINNNENVVKNESIVLNHYPDNKKSRSNYLKLLELSVKEEPNNDRHLHYLGREYMYYKKWNKCIDTLIKHLKLPTSVWKDERSASMRFIARAYQNLQRIDEARMWLKKAIKETPYLRDPYLEMALLEYNINNWKEVYKYCKKALKIKTHEKTYINEIFSWDYTVFDLLALSSYYQGNLDEAIRWINKALKMELNNERLLNNKIYFEKEKSS